MMRTLLFLNVVCISHMSFGQAQGCRLEDPHRLYRFGESCEYLCHCQNTECNRNTGECPINIECDPGWMGSGCQYANIAYNAGVQSNQWTNQENIVDGKKSTCANPSYPGDAIEINLMRKVKITEAYLLFSTTAPPFNVSVLGSDGVKLCGSVTETAGQKEFIVKCANSLYGEGISITFHGRNATLPVCELQIPAGRNLAYEKTTNQSSTLGVFYASRAVDGVTYHDEPYYTCTHTLTTTNPWWLLDLQAPVIIQWFRIYNRADDNSDKTLNERLKNFRIFLSEDDANFTKRYQDNSTDPPLVIQPGLNPDVMARYVKIDLQGNDRILTLCEVEVLGDCTDGLYADCSKACTYCLRQECDKVTGYCIECNPGYYGKHCNESCAYCKDRNCHKDTGKCLSCPPGKLGDHCETDCSNFSFGANCSARCGNCSNEDICDKATGNCPRGCQNGWTGEQCLQECSLTYYGQNCSSKCGYCLNGTCDRFTGNCSKDVGCQPGWQGSRCDIGPEAIQKPNDPVIDARILGGSVGAAVAIIGIIIAIVIFIIVKRRRHERSPPMTQSTRNFSRKNNDGLVYENSAFVNINDGILPNQGMRKEPSAITHSAIPKPGKTTVKPKNEDPESYYNIKCAMPAGAIPLFMFWDYVQEKFLDQRYFSKEFEKLPSGPQFPTTIALRPENRNKNRYKQLYAYDVNRVQLKPLGEDRNDYINASFVDGYSCQKMYIASQGTTKDNINDFWRMLWQHDVEKIVMLTELFEGGRHKCELYWPEEEGHTRMFGNVVVRLLDTDTFADYDIRTLEMSVGNKSKKLTQFHFTAWPDKGVPKAASSIVQFWNTANKVSTKEPIVVHCSAGIGRTGTYIALDYLVSQGKAEGHLNVSACVSKLRCQRVNLVQTQEQYIFLHETLVEALMLSGTATTSDNFPKAYSELLEIDCDSGKFKLQLEYERLQNEVVNHEAVYATIKMEDDDGGEGDSNQDEFSAAKSSENRTKNRHDNILPADRHRVFISTPVSGRNDYINAVVLPSHRERKGFIVTQMPLNNTVIDFWRMINDSDIKTIIMFNSENSKTHDIGIYWPAEGEARYGPFSIRLTKQEKCKNYIERTLSFSLIGEEYDRSVKQFQFTNWAENSHVPGSTDSILQLLLDVETWQKETGARPVVVHCLNGAQRSGLYCVISTVIERLKVERDVAITQTIKRSRAIRQQIIPNYEQFQFCHECILQYMKTFETYSNF